MLSCPRILLTAHGSVRLAWEETLQGPEYQEVRIIRTILETGQSTRLAIGKQ